MILTFQIEADGGESGFKTSSKFHLVDLAGSERLDKSGATGDRLKETQVRVCLICTPAVAL